jgi:very-short-patch-repair endonuclease
MTKITRTIENTMYYNAPEFILRLAKELRANQTKAEKELWNIIGAKKVMGLHFRRQHPINMYIADFYCHTIRLVIEIDGGIHKKREKHENDLNRTAELERFGITVIRFSNNDVFNNIEMVKIRIERDCKDLIKEQRLNQY